MGIWSWEHDREKAWVPAGNDVVEPIPRRWPANYCMGEPNAAVGRMMLRRLDAINAQGRDQAARFLTSLADCPELNFQHVPDGCQHVYHLMAARYDQNRRLHSSNAPPRELKFLSIRLGSTDTSPLDRPMAKEGLRKTSVES